MNQAPSTQSTNSSAQSLFNGAFKSGFETKEYEQTEPVSVEPTGDTVPDSEEYRKTISNHWAEFYTLKTEDLTPQTAERPVSRIEITETRLEVQTSETSRSSEKEEVIDSKPYDLIEKQKGSGSWVEDAGLKLDFKSLFGFLGDIGKSFFGALSLFREIAMDTVTMVVGKRDKQSFSANKKAEKVDPNPEKARAAAEKKAENQRKQGNIKAFYEGLKAQMGSVVSVEAVQMETQEKENINKTIKLTNTSYKGIKNSFGRLTVYAASMFEREQLDQEKQAKKIEKQQKIASAGGGPDLNMDKVAEGGFLSSTGGQGAG